ncbi:ABC transporter substrate-binding protein [Agromyces mediolanus]|uniref:ABC transporter substrate-binding protein n=1 Tax=Agromyces mediolanus TaxID=41986 RepID=A0A918FG76_AGRME|nr:ABC transporter substrate-binding protein [Agromyces mediolanus]GGR35841.1 ABC transporter substrate-binding protein [Agromyces mediolanus]GLJ73065.1 ABC transporter substrate-binding protein [Agromyces mediolanus]
MKKRLIAAAALTALALSGCTAAADAEQQAAEGGTASANSAVDLSKIEKSEAAAKLLPADIVERGTFVLAVDATYPPNEFKDDAGNPIGWEVDLMNAAIVKLGLEPKNEISKFENIIPKIELGTYDSGIAGYYDTVKRQENFDMVDFFLAGNQFGSLKENPISDELDICGQKISVPNGGSAPLYYLPEVEKRCAAEGKGSIEVMGYDTTDEMVAAVTLGRAFAFVADSPVVSYAVKNSGGKLVASEIYETLPAGAPFKKGNDELVAAFAAAVQELHDDGTYDEILEFWGVEAGRLDAITVNAGTE